LVVEIDTAKFGPHSTVECRAHGHGVAGRKRAVCCALKSRALAAFSFSRIAYLQELMADPVVTCDGHTYERSAIEYWLQSNNTSPITNEPLSSKALIPNFLLRSQIAAFKDANPQSTFAGGSSSPPPPAPISAWSAAGAPVVSSTVVATPSPPAPLPAGAGHALLKEEMNKKKNKTIRLYTGDNGGAAEEEISPSERSSSLVNKTRSFPGGSSTHISAPASEPKPLERSKSSQDAQKALERALASKGQFSFGSFGGYRVSPDAALLRVQAWRSFRERFGTTAFVPSMHYLTWSP